MSAPVIPAFIIARDRLSCLRQLCEDCVRLGFVPVIIDQESTYPALLEWYKRCPYRVIKHRNSHPHDVFPDVVCPMCVGECLYVVTDHDLYLGDVPDDAKAKMLTALRNHPDYTKVGLSLYYKDVPLAYPFRRDVIDNEKHHWQRFTDDGCFIADTDTTFALYYNTHDPTKPAAGEQEHRFYKALRLPEPYTARHLPWYKSPPFSAEECYFLENAADVSQWTKLIKRHYHFPEKQ